MVQEGFEVHVVAAADGGFAELADLGVHGKPAPLGWQSNVAGLVGAFFIVQAHVIEQEPILLHGFGPVVGWMSALAADRAGVPAVVASVEAPPERRNHDRGWSLPGRLLAPELLERLEEPIVDWVDGAERRIAGALLRRLVDRVDVLLVSSEGGLEHLAEEVGLPRYKLEMIVGGDGVDVEQFDPEALSAPEEVRGELGVPEDWRRVVGYAGPLRADRGVADLLATIEEVASRRRGVGWLIAGTDDASASVERRLDELVEAGEAIVVDRDDPKFYRALDLFAYPRTSRGMPMPLMRAQSMAVPVLAYASQGTESVVAEGQTGHLLGQEERHELPAAIDGLLDRPRRLRDYGVRARARSTGRFDRRDVERQLLRLYDRLLERKLAPSDAEGEAR